MKGQLNIIGDMVRQKRKEKNWTQNDLAAACQRLGWQLIRETLIKIELGTRRVVDSEILILSKALDCTPNDLLTIPFDQVIHTARHSKLD